MKQKNHLPELFSVCRKNPKSLSGIETEQLQRAATRQQIQAGKTLNPYQGLKLAGSVLASSAIGCRKNPKSLSGIETEIDADAEMIDKAGKTLNPYQGLKQIPI